MASQAQIDANRRNSQKSTGPRSAEGKARSRQNALKTGLYAVGITIGHENPFNLVELERQFTAEFHPVTPAERSLVDSLIHIEWLLRRYRWLETEVWKASIDSLNGEQLEGPWTGHAFMLQPAISRIHRLRNSTQRQFRETLADLRALQVAQPNLEPVVEAAPQLVENTSDARQIGFVPSISDEADPTPESPSVSESQPLEAFLPSQERTVTPLHPLQVRPGIESTALPRIS